ncbi:hypothetical protein [Kitasatospora sp. NPDC097643]|uniref:hypothetical protein n=1 Tax=Kitasatospora sp. NPDC097643 TaxID=3157230 RepID=UPI0033305B3F
MDRTRRQHRGLLDAIAGRRPDIAHACATVHIARVGQWLRDTLGEADSAPGLPEQ